MRSLRRNSLRISRLIFFEKESKIKYLHSAHGDSKTVNWKRLVEHSGIIWSPSGDTKYRICCIGFYKTVFSLERDKGNLPSSSSCLVI